MSQRSAAKKKKAAPAPRPAARRSKAVRTSYRHGHLRDALVEEALRIMLKSADSSFTLRQVAQRLGVSHSAAYRHYPSKGALLADIAHRGFVLLGEALSQTLESGKPPEEILRLQGRAYVRTALTYPAHFRCMFGPQQFTKDEEAHVEEAGEKAYACVAETVHRLLKVDIESPVGENAMLAVWSIVHGLAHLAVDDQLCEMAGDGAMQRYEEMADGVTAALLGGLRPK